MVPTARTRDTLFGKTYQIPCPTSYSVSDSGWLYGSAYAHFGSNTRHPSHGICGSESGFADDYTGPTGGYSDSLTASDINSCSDSGSEYSDAHL